MAGKEYIILNIMIVILELIGVYLSLPERSWGALAYYTILSNLMTLLSSALLLIFGPAPATILLRYLASCMMAMTFLVTTCVLIPLGGDPKMLLFSGNRLFHHLVCPVFCVYTYIFFEKHSRMWAVPVLFTFAYGMLMLYLNHKKVVDGPYPFFRVGQQSARKTVIWMAALLCLIAVISLLLMLAAK